MVRTAILHFFSEAYSAFTPPVARGHEELATWLSGDYHDRTSTGKLIQTFKTHHSRYGLHARRVAYATLYTEGSSSFVTSTAASVATGRSEPVPGWDFHPLWTSAFSRSTRNPG